MRSAIGTFMLCALVASNALALWSATMEGLLLALDIGRNDWNRLAASHFPTVLIAIYNLVLAAAFWSRCALATRWILPSIIVNSLMILWTVSLAALELNGRSFYLWDFHRILHIHVPMAAIITTACATGLIGPVAYEIHVHQANPHKDALPKL